MAVLSWLMIQTKKELLKEANLLGEMSKSLDIFTFPR